MENSGNNNKISGNIFSSNYKFSAANPFDNGFKPNDTSNPFETKPANQPENQAAPTSNPIKRLNGYDSTILNNTKFDKIIAFCERRTTLKKLILNTE